MINACTCTMQSVREYDKLVGAAIMLEGMNHMMDPSEMQPIFKLGVRILRKFNMHEFTDAVLLFASVSICEDKLNLLFEEMDVNLRKLLSLLEKEIEKEAVSLPECSTGELSKLDFRGFTKLARYAMNNPMYSDQIACGSLYFLYNLLLTLDEKESLLTYNIDKKLWINTLKNSSELFLEAHTNTTRELTRDEIEYLKIQLTSNSIMTRFFAGISLIRQNEYLAEIRNSFNEIIGDEKSHSAFDWSSVPPEVNSSIAEFLRQIMYSDTFKS